MSLNEGRVESEPRARDARAPAAQRSMALDFLRGFAILLVIGQHGGISLDGRSVLGTLAWGWTQGGWMGVDLFFVLSGFLVSGLLFREYQRYATVSVGQFLIRRGLKIYPAFYVFLAYTIVSPLLGADTRLTPAAIASEAMFVQNYGPRLWWHTWSLAVEEHFYLLCAVGVWLLARRSKPPQDPFRPLPWIFVMLAILCLAARLATGRMLPFKPRTHIFPTHLRIDGLMFGVCLSYLYHFRRALLTAWVKGRELLLVAAGALLLLPAFLWPIDTFLLHTVGLTALYLGSGLIVVALVFHGIGRSLPVRLVAWIGSSSYSIYLWHLAVRFWIWRGAAAFGSPASALHVFALYAVGSVLLGALMAWLIEMPVLRLRDRLVPSRSV
jgi:peptidoglycan/LPS O-acetylase OafA/YrhL